MINTSTNTLPQIPISSPAPRSVITVISYRRDANAKGASKYAVSKRLRISEKMLREWIAKESDILIQRNGQWKGTIGRVASLPQMEDYLHEQFLKPRVQEVKVKRAWFISEGKKWYVLYL